MRKTFLAALIIMAWTCISSADEIIYNLGVDPRTIDPALNYALDGCEVDVNIFEGLLRVNSDSRPEPGSAQSWDVSPDGLTWTFHLREGLKWSDGQPLTASHFRDGFLRVLDPKTGSPYANYAFFIKNGRAYYEGRAKPEDVGLTAPDDKTFVVQLEYHNPLMLDYMMFPLFQAARMDVINENPRGWAARPETLISNGPFKLESWKHGDGGEMILVKNPHYWDAANVKAERLRFVFITDSNTAFAAFRAGRIDYANGAPAMLVPMLLKSGAATTKPSLTVSFIEFNIHRKPFDDLRVRKAFTLAIDRRLLVDKILFGGQTPATGFVCPGIPGRTDSEDFRTEGGAFLPESADVQEARRLLAEAGYPEGKGFPEVVYKYSTSPGGKRISEALQGMWKKALGVEVKLLNEEWKVFLETRRNLDFDMAISAWAMDFMDSMNLFEQFVSDSPLNDSKYSRKDFDEVMSKAAYEMDRVKRTNYLHEAERILMEDLPVSPMYFGLSIEMKTKRVKNIHMVLLGYVLFRDAEITE